MDEEIVTYVNMYVYVYIHIYTHIYIHTQIYTCAIYSLYVMEYYSAIKMNEVLPFVVIWVKLEDIK